MAAGAVCVLPDHATAPVLLRTQGVPGGFRIFHIELFLRVAVTDDRDADFADGEPLGLAAESTNIDSGRVVAMDLADQVLSDPNGVVLVGQVPYELGCVRTPRRGLCKVGPDAVRLAGSYFTAQPSSVERYPCRELRPGRRRVPGDGLRSPVARSKWPLCVVDRATAGKVYRWLHALRRTRKRPSSLYVHQYQKPPATEFSRWVTVLCGPAFRMRFGW